jgi:hypothetical protein
MIKIKFIVVAKTFDVDSGLWISSRHMQSPWDSSIEW